MENYTSHNEENEDLGFTPEINTPADAREDLRLLHDRIDDEDEEENEDDDDKDEDDDEGTHKTDWGDVDPQHNPMSPRSPMDPSVPGSAV